MKAVLLDLMDTILADPYRETVLRLCPKGCSLEEFQDARRMDSFIRFESGLIHESTFLREYYKEGFDHKKRGFPEVLKIKKELFRSLSYLPGMEEMLRNLKNESSVRTGIVSNYSPWYTVLLSKKRDLESYFDYLFFSCEIGARKPEAEFYNAVFSALQNKMEPGHVLDPGDIFFADDREENAAQAQNFGWKAHHFRNAEGLKSALHDFLK